MHSFFATSISKRAHKATRGTGLWLILHLFGELELVFAIWTVPFLVLWLIKNDLTSVFAYLSGLHFIEPVFVFCIMVVAATKPILMVARQIIYRLGQVVARLCRLPKVQADILVILVVGPLLGSLITEPAAMTVTGFLLVSVLGASHEKMLHAALAVLFVNISIGGALTHFAAPPILMVAGTWQWNFKYIFFHFGWKAVIAVIVNSVIFITFYRNQILENCHKLEVLGKTVPVPLWVSVVHIFMLLLFVLNSSSLSLLSILIVVFWGLVQITKKYHEQLRVKESILVAVFLAGIVFFGGFQSWWLQPLLQKMSEQQIYLSTVFLTAIADNAALTYLGAQVSDLSESAKYYLVAGAVAGGGLTIIANAPNAAGLSILQSKLLGRFSPLRLFVYALPPTIVAVLAFRYLPNLG